MALAVIGLQSAGGPRGTRGLEQKEKVGMRGGEQAERGVWRNSETECACGEHVRGGGGVEVGGAPTGCRSVKGLW